ncbi:Protein containing transglutaminase-like domain protein [Mycobacterium sp. 012931]|nr:Protein containing transglutaminase-like domain protein [Mycobacterium sp. 012931]
MVAVVDGREVRSQLLSLLSDALFGSPDTKRYRVTHRTEYRYSDIVTSSYGRGFLTPRDSLRQRCVTHQITIDPTPADSSTSRDTYGNISSYFHVTEPHRVLGITSDSIVDVAPPDSGLYTSGPALLPWEAARPSGMQGALAVDFALDLDPAEITDEVREYAAVSFLPERPLVEALRDLTTRIYNDFTYRSGSTTVSTRVNEVLQAREGVCQDFARLAIACLRANGLAACYVSGYLATDPPPGKDRMIGIDATHAWAAVWTPQQPGQFEWMGLDPTNDQLVDERYIVVGRGRDYADVPPVRGIIYTNSEHSVIDVGVDVVPFEGDVLDA